MSEETSQTVGASCLSEELDGWIDAEKKRPPLIHGKDYSANVWGWDGMHTIMVVSFYIDSNGWHCANAYGDVFGEGLFDDDYDIKYWQPITIPTLPNAKLTGRDYDDKN
jgi:hypothetical protein